jgi:hypothetical protein
MPSVPRPGRQARAAACCRALPRSGAAPDSLNYGCNPRCFDRLDRAARRYTAFHGADGCEPIAAEIPPRRAVDNPVAGSRKSLADEVKQSWFEVAVEVDVAADVSVNDVVEVEVAVQAVTKQAVAVVVARAVATEAVPL